MPTREEEHRDVVALNEAQVVDDGQFVARMHVALFELDLLEPKDRTRLIALAFGGCGNSKPKAPMK